MGITIRNQLKMIAMTQTTEVARKSGRKAEGEAEGVGAVGAEAKVRTMTRTRNYNKFVDTRSCTRALVKMLLLQRTRWRLAAEGGSCRRAVLPLSCSLSPGTALQQYTSAWSARAI